MFSMIALLASLQAQPGSLPQLPPVILADYYGDDGSTERYIDRHAHDGESSDGDRDND